MSEIRTHRYLMEHQLQEISILDLIRAGLDKDDIVNTITSLYKTGNVVLSYGGIYPFNAITISVHPSKWDWYIKNSIGSQNLRSMYRNKILKKEILLMREIMWNLVKNLFKYRLDEVYDVGSYTHPASWTFIRTTRKFGEI